MSARSKRPSREIRLEERRRRRGGAERFDRAPKRERERERARVLRETSRWPRERSDPRVPRVWGFGARSFRNLRETFWFRGVPRVVRRVSPSRSDAQHVFFLGKRDAEYPCVMAGRSPSWSARSRSCSHDTCRYLQPQYLLVTRSFPVRFGLRRVPTTRAVCDFLEHSPSSSPDTVSTTLKHQTPTLADASGLST